MYDASCNRSSFYMNGQILLKKSYRLCSSERKKEDFSFSDHCPLKFLFVAMMVVKV